MSDLTAKYLWNDDHIPNCGCRGDLNYCDENKLGILRAAIVVELAKSTELQAKLDLWEKHFGHLIFGQRIDGKRTEVTAKEYIDRLAAKREGI